MSERFIVSSNSWLIKNKAGARDAGQSMQTAYAAFRHRAGDGRWGQLSKRLLQTAAKLIEPLTQG